MATYSEAVLVTDMETDVIPPDTNPFLWMATRSIKRDTHATKESLANLEVRTKALEEDYKDHDTSIDHLKSAVEVLTAKVKRSEITQSQLQNEIEDLKSRSMRENLIFNFNPNAVDYKEAKNEDCVKKIHAFLRNILNITDVYISTAHRLGAFVPGSNRPIIARVMDGSKRGEILKSNSRLRDTGHYINSQIPPSRAERKQFALPDYKIKKEKKDNRAEFRNERLFIRGKEQIQFANPKLPESDLPNFYVDMKVSKQKKEGGSSFRGYYACASSLKDVSDAHTQLICDPNVAKATHVIYAYRFTEHSKTVENFQSDRDWGTGHALLKAMRDEDITGVCFAIRVCHPGYSHIGKK